MIRAGCFVMIISIALGCGRENLEEYDDNFTGTWRNTDTLYTSAGDIGNCYMKIDGKNSEIKMYCDSTNSCQSKGEGKVLINKSREFILINAVPNGQKLQFRVNAFPYQDANGVWRCVISNTMMVRE